MGWKTWNDRLSLLLLLGIPLLWLSHRWLPIPAEATGASIAVWTLVAQHYFRKASETRFTEEAVPRESKERG